MEQNEWALKMAGQGDGKGGSFEDSTQTARLTVSSGTAFMRGKWTSITHDSDGVVVKIRRRSS